MTSESGCVAHQHAQISDLLFDVNIWIIKRFVGWCKFYFMKISQKFDHVGIEIHIVCICPFVQLTEIILYHLCPLHLLFLEVEGFEYHQQSMILLSPLFRYLYQTYVLRRGVALPLAPGVRHFWIELHLMLFHWRQHIVVCLMENCVFTHRLYH